MAEQTHQDDGGRADREARFHDARFSDTHPQRRSSRFYDLADSSRREFATRIASVAAPARVLEIGCGPGSVATSLWSRGVETDGIDISPAAIRTSRADAVEHGIDPGRFVVMNAEQLEFPDATFDAVVGSGILHHLDLHRGLTEIKRVLRRDGRAMFYEPLGKNPAINLYRRLTPSDRSEDEHPLTERDLALLHAMFDEVQLEYFHLTSLAALPLCRTPAFGPTARFLERLDQRLFARVAALRSLAWVVVIEAVADND